MSTTRPLQDLLDARRHVLLAYDATVRSELLSAAAAWGLDGDVKVGLTIYERVHGRTPQLGGHWTLSRAAVTPGGHELTSASVSLEFADTRPVDFRVSGSEDVIAGACTTSALREALLQCGGPLRQLLPFPVDRAESAPVFPAHLVPYTASAIGPLN